MHATSLFKIVPTTAFLSIEALGMDEFGQCCSKRNAKHAPMFLQFGYSKSDIIKVWKQTTIVTSEKKKKEIVVCKKFAFKNRLQINAEAVFERLHLKNFLRHQKWCATALLILFNVQSPDFWLKRLGRSDYIFHHVFSYNIIFYQRHGQVKNHACFLGYEKSCITQKH